MSERKTLGIATGATKLAGPKSSFALTGARADALKERAREARRNPGDAAQQLWAELTGSKLGGVKFQRATVVGSTVADFAAPSRWIVIQLSPEGANPQVDALQDRKLTEVGVRVLRFAESAVLSDIEAVLKEINAAVNEPFDKRAARKAAGARFAPIDEEDAS